VTAESSGHLSPLHCPACQAPVPLGAADGDRTRCPFCAADVAIPSEVLALRKADRDDAGSRARAAELFRSLGRPPSAIARFLVGSIARIATVAAIFVPLPITAAVLFIAHGGGMFGVQLYDVLTDAQQAGLTVVAPLVLLAIGLVLARAARRNAIALGGLRAALAARPPERSGGTALCRQCGAALEHGPSDLGVTCLYCRADNLLRMPAAWLARMKRHQVDLGAAVTSAEAALAAERRRYRRSLLWRLGWAAPVLAIPVLIVWRGCGEADTLPDPGVTPDWQATVRARGVPLRCEGSIIDLGAIILTDGECVDTGCVPRRLFALRKGERLRMVTGAPEEWRRATPLDATVRIDRHVQRFIGGGDPDRKDWGDEIARLRVREGQPAELRAPLAGWYRATAVIPGAKAGEWYSLCFEIVPR
jgi:hypothetical protein